MAQTPAHTPAQSSGVFHRLDAEWAALCADTAVQAAVADWLAADQLADDVSAVADAVADDRAHALGPAQLLAALRPGVGHVTDPLLRNLLRRAAGRDRSAALAARIVVQAMVPAAVRITRGQVRPFGGQSFEEIGHVTVAALFEVARSGRIHSRPGRPAANLALDTLRHVCAEVAADREEGGEPLAAAEHLADRTPDPAQTVVADAVRTAAAAAGLTPDRHACEVEATGARLELLELVLDAIDGGALTPADGHAIAWHYTAAIPDTEAAVRAGTTAGAWQRRRSRAVARLAAALPRRCAE
ncbi:hypothetical protein STHAL_32380 [Streptomyces halstedii]|uniref:DUF222 domain-containing protein n=1 Tax=Streptomyces halstedii TaxID=1944 RepID=A0ABS6U0S7_STRHA|nr:hypothetical protein [Streptomyces halstedii]